jgi:branched-chain amino acid transport system permease protein
VASTTHEAALRGRRISITNVIGICLLVLAGLWVVWNFQTDFAQTLEVAIIGLCNGALYALVALGYTLVYGIIELINFAHGDLFMLCTIFSATMLTEWLGFTTSSPTAWLAFLLTMACAMLAGGAVNVSVERIAYRRLRGAGKLAPLITAVGVSFIFQNLGLLWNGSVPKSIPTVVGVGNLNIGSSISIQWAYILTVLITIPLLLALQYLVRYTRPGKAMRATAQDPAAARLMGIDVNRTIAFTFLLGGAMAGAAGMMYVQDNGTTRYDVGLQFGLIAFTAAVLGGVGNLGGAVLGGFLIGLIQGLNDGAPHGLGQGFSQTVVFTILITVMVFRPSGLLGSTVQDKV